MKIDRVSPVACLLITALAANVACATRQHVREALAPVTGRVHKTQDQVRTLNGQIDQDRQRIGDLDRRLATVEEKTSDAESKSNQATALASQAMGTASNAARRADAAAALAQKTQQALAQADQRIGRSFENLSSYRLVFSEKIYFGFSESRLSAQEKSKLESAIRRIGGLKNYLVEVEGFADSSGDALANRQLSRKRADAVVHYLVVEHGVPLRSVWELAAGADFPSADNQTPSARRENRRVDLRIYSNGAPAL